MIFAKKKNARIVLEEGMASMATGGGGLGHRDPLYRRLGLGGSGNKPKVVVLLPHRFHTTINIISCFITQPWKMREVGYTTGYSALL